MTLEKLWLDNNHLQCLEQLAIAEGLITHTSEDVESDRQPQRVEPGDREELVPADRMLRLITIYNTVDSSFTPLDWSKMAELGLLAPNAELPNGMYENFTWAGLKNPQSTAFEQLTPQQQRYVLHARNSAESLLVLARSEIIEAHVRRAPAGTYSSTSRYHFQVDDLYKHYDACVEAVLADGWYEKEPALYAFESDIAYMYDSLLKGIYISSMEGCAFAGPTAAEPKHLPKREAQRVDEVYSLVETRLTDEILYLPDPRSIEEAVELRNNEHMASFRRVLADWLEIIKAGDVAAEQKIRNDMRRANRALRILGRVREFKRSPLNWLLLGLGLAELPWATSAAIGGLGILMEAMEQGVEAQYGWTKLCR